MYVLPQGFVGVGTKFVFLLNNVSAYTSVLLCACFSFCSFNAKFFSCSECVKQSWKRQVDNKQPSNCTAYSKSINWKGTFKIVLTCLKVSENLLIYENFKRCSCFLLFCISWQTGTCSILACHKILDFLQQSSRILFSIFGSIPLAYFTCCGTQGSWSAGLLFKQS